MTAPIPRTVQIAGQRVKVRMYKELRETSADGQSVELFGAFNAAEMEIQIMSGQAPERSRLTLLHEAVHFLWSIGRFGGCDDEEEFVGRVTPLLFSLLRDNPKVLAYLRDVSS